MSLLFFILGLYGFGFCLSTIISPGTPRAVRLIIAFPLGAGIFPILVFCITQSSGLLISRAFLVSFLLAGLCISSFYMLIFRCNNKSPEYIAESPPTSLAHTEFLFICILFILIAIVGIFVPVENWDVYLEYLPFSRQIFSTGSLPAKASPIAPLVLPAMPPNHVLLIALGYILQGGIVHPWARGLSPLYAALIILLLYQIGRRHLAFSLEVTLGGIFLCLTLPIFSEYAMVPSNCLPFSFHALASLYFIMLWFGVRRTDTAVMTGLFFGIAYWTSYAGAVFIACMFTLVIGLILISFTSTRKEIRGLRVPFSHIALIFLIAIAIAAPHIIRNYLLFGNPVYPAFYKIFGGVWINDWSIAHVIHIIVPQHSYLRLRWEIFHEGFFIQLLFALALSLGTWYRSRKNFVLGVFCILYLFFYLVFLTWPRSSGISIKLFLPALIPACLFAGETLNLILNKRIYSWQSLLILSLIPVWSIVMLRDASSWEDVKSISPSTGSTSMITLLWALINDLDEMLIWLGVALCFLAAHTSSRKLLRRIAPVFLLLALACRPMADAMQFLIQHINSYIQNPSYSFWNAASFPYYFPEATWIDMHLPRKAVIGTFDDRTYLYPREVIPLDSPRFWSMYQGMNIQQAITLLLNNGVTHLCLSDYTAKTHPLYGMSPLFHYVGDPYYMPLLYTGPFQGKPGHEVKVYKIMQNGNRG